MSDDEQLSEQDIAPFVEYFEQQDATYRQRNERPYDGVVGRLPGWVPEWHQEQFELTRNRLLDYGAYNKPISPLIVRGYIKIYMHLGIDRDSSVATSGEQTNGPEWIPPEVMRDVGYLSCVRWAVWRGPKRGLQELSGRMAVRGADYTQRTKRGGEKGALARWGKSDASTIAQAAQKLLSAGHKKRGLAAKLTKRFTLSERQINRILKNACI